MIVSEDKGTTVVAGVIVKWTDEDGVRRKTPVFRVEPDARALAATLEGCGMPYVVVEDVRIPMPTLERIDAWRRSRKASDGAGRTSVLTDALALLQRISDEHDPHERWSLAPSVMDEVDAILERARG